MAENEPLAKVAMFFAGLILLIPHRIGMSRVNYVIKRYNLPISRAGLLLYKYHNNIELSLTIGTLAGNIIVWIGGGLITGSKWPMSVISGFMIAFLILMLISSIIMYIIYISGDDFGHLNAFYFSLIFLTLFDGFANAFAFGINGKYSYMLSAGIPLSGFLVTILHYVYKFFSDSFHWDDFDYYVLRLQLICNILTILIALILWAVDLQVNHTEGDAHDVADIMDLFSTHVGDFSPIFLLAISLGTVYAFYPSIAPYSIIDFQYASVIELWILIISALLPLSFAILDYFNEGYGPAGKSKFMKSKFLIPKSSIMVTHTNATDSSANKKVYHTSDTTGTACQVTNPDTTAHAYGSTGSNYSYYIQTGDKYRPTGSSVTTPIDIPIKSGVFYTHNWFGVKNIDDDNGTISTNTTYDPYYYLFNCIWLCAIFYILCIQIFMSLLHYPNCILSCFFNKPFRIQFISILFNTLRELMQAFGFSGAGKQCLLPTTGSNNIYTGSDTYTIKSTISSAGEAKITLTLPQGVYIPDTDNPTETDEPITWNNSDISGAALKDPKDDLALNTTIAATNKLITLFVMMFCVFTGDGYLQHYRRCCRDNWPTTGYIASHYWLH